MPAFFLLSLTLFLIWCLFLVFSKNTRQEQLLISVIGIIFMPLVLALASLDPRGQPTDMIFSLGIEDLLFSFSLFGLAAIIYQAVLGRHLRRLKVKKPIITPFGQTIILIMVWTLLAIAFLLVYNFPLLTALVTSGVLIGIYVIIRRRDLFLDALLSSLFLTFMLFILEQIYFVHLFPTSAELVWHRLGLSGIIIGGIPLEELLWIAVIGFAVGPLYEFVRSLRLTKK